MGGVDWNRILDLLVTEWQLSPPTWVVWIEISSPIWTIQSFMSPPTWVVWIEIWSITNCDCKTRSHHPHGWCGLKSIQPICYNCTYTSHHPHGWCGLKSYSVLDCLNIWSVTTHMGGVDWNWIRLDSSNISVKVTTHMGGVDWNSNWLTDWWYKLCHHPHGWCGLK